MYLCVCGWGVRQPRRIARFFFFFHAPCFPPQKLPLPNPTVKRLRSTVTFPPALVRLASNVLPVPMVCWSLSSATVAMSKEDVSWKMKRTAVRAKSRTDWVTGDGEAGGAPGAGVPLSPAAKMMLFEVWAEARAWRTGDGLDRVTGEGWRSWARSMGAGDGGEEEGFLE